MNLRHWFLPAVPDVLGMLDAQAEISVVALDELVAWSGGDRAAADRLRDAEEEAGRRKHVLWRALRTALSTPYDREDLYRLSFTLDEILNGAHDLVRENDLFGLSGRDEASVRMAELVRDATKALRSAFANMDDADTATACADDARHAARDLEHAYLDAMRDVLALEDLRRVWIETARYGRYLELGARVLRVSDRVWYAVVKEA